MKKELALGLAIGLASVSVQADAPLWGTKLGKAVKCKGIAKKGQNDCGANGHPCSGHATKSGDPNEWIFVPEGVCEKIVGGVVWKTNKF